MDRPPVYGNSYVVNRNLAYEIVELLPSGKHLGGGVLGKGQRVWMQHEPQATTLGRAVSAYVEGIGVINLNPHSLSPLIGQKPPPSTAADKHSTKILPKMRMLFLLGDQL